MPERKEIIHYCKKCGKEMKYKEKKMLYIYDIVVKEYEHFNDFQSRKRMAINLCENCCNELQRVINSWNKDIKENKDDFNEAVHGLDIFTKNWCMNCKETNKQDDLVFRCDECEFQKDDGTCMIKLFANNHSHNYPMDNFGSMGSH